MRQVQVGGRPVEIEDSGGEGPPILCSTDGASADGGLGPLATALRRRHRVLVWSSTPAEPGWESGHDLLEVLDGLGIERAVLAGVRAGGEASLRAAVLAPDRVRALVLIAAGIPRPDPDHLADRVLEVDAPTLLVRGGADPRVTDDDVAALRADLFDLRGDVVVADAEQAPHVTHPEVVEPAIRDFLDGLPA